MRTIELTAPHAAHEVLDSSSGMPMIVRLGGLSTSAMDAFGSRLSQQARELLALEEELRHARRRLVDRLYVEIGSASPEARRTLLTVKRDAFNGRGLDRHADLGNRAGLRALAGSEMAAVLALETERAVAADRFAAAFAAQQERERKALLHLLEERRFVRGVALSSPLLAENLPRLERPSHGGTNRRERRLEQSLARFASRAALKLSPFSSLTATALALTTSTRGDPPLRIEPPETWREGSSVRLQRYLVEQVAHALAAYTPFRDSLPVTLNDTLEPLPDGRSSLIRPGRWIFDQAISGFDYQRPALVKATLSSVLYDWLLAHLQGRELPYRDLLIEVSSALSASDPTLLRAKVDELLAIGVLHFQWPWTAADDAIETRLLAHLDAMVPPDEHLAALAATLRGIVELLAGYAATPTPSSVAAEVKRQVRELFTAVSRFDGVEPQIAGTIFKDWCVHEDVFWHAPAPERPLVHLATTTAREIRGSLEPLVRLSNLFSSRHDFMHSLGRLAARSFPGQIEISFLDLLRVATPLLKEYVRFDIATRRRGPLRVPAFNPLDSAAVDDLGRERQRVVERLENLLLPVDEGVQLDRQSLERLLDSVQGPYSRRRDFCAFVQPADAAGDTWVANLLCEGAGRLSSRFTSVMNAPERTAFDAFFGPACTFFEDGEEQELIDIYCPAGNTANVHRFYTPRVLTMPGETLAVDAHRRLTVRDLRVRLAGTDRLPALVDTRGRRLLPVHLGAINFRFIPFLSKFLALFGPGELRAVLPKKSARRQGDLEVVDRHAIDRVIYQRKSWLFAPKPLRAMLFGLSPAAAFRALCAWRAERGIPECTFLSEPASSRGGSALAKPQYIDFTSCVFVSIFRAALDDGASRLRLVETLPAPDRMPLVAPGRRIALELQLDGFAVPLSTRSRCAVRGQSSTS